MHALLKLRLYQVESEPYCQIWKSFTLSQCLQQLARLLEERKQQLFTLCMSFDMLCLQAIKQCMAVHRKGVAQDDHAAQHERQSMRQGLSELLQEWVADMRAAGLKHIGPSLTALVQVMHMLMHVIYASHIDNMNQMWCAILIAGLLMLKLYLC